MIPESLRRAAPLATFIVALAAGSVWMVRFVRAEVAPPPPMPRPPAVLVTLVPPPAPRPMTVKDPDLRVLHARLTELLKAIAEQRAANDTSAADLDVLQKKVDDLRAEVESLEARRAALLSASETIGPENDAALEIQISNERKTVAAREQDLANAQVQLDAEPWTRSFSASLVPLRQLPAPVELIGNRIAPVDRDFFQFPLIVLSSRLVLTKKHPGETIAEAGQPDSRFAKFLEQVRREHCYVSCLLNSDSFDAFFAVRNMARRAGVEVSWEPAWTQDGKVAITRVRLVGRASGTEKTVELPGVVR